MALVTADRRELFWQLARYGVNGGLLTGLFAIVYWIAVRELLAPPQIGTLAGYLVSATAGYLLHSRVTFRAHGERDRGTRLRFAAASIVSYLLNAVFTWACTAAMHWPTWTPLVPISTVTPIALFALNRLWVFR